MLSNGFDGLGGIKSKDDIFFHSGVTAKGTADGFHSMIGGFNDAHIRPHNVGTLTSAATFTLSKTNQAAVDAVDVTGAIPDKTTAQVLRGHPAAVVKGGNNPRAYFPGGHDYSAGDKVVVSEARVAATVGGTRLTHTGVGCTKAAPTICTLANHGLSFGDRLKITYSAKTGGAFATVPTDGDYLFARPLTANTFNLEYDGIQGAAVDGVLHQPVSGDTSTDVAGLTFTKTGAGGLAAGTRYNVKSATLSGVRSIVAAAAYPDPTTGTTTEKAASAYAPASGIITFAADHGFANGDVIAFTGAAQTNTKLAPGDLFIVSAVPTGGLTLVLQEIGDGTSIVLLKTGDTAADLKFAAVPYIELETESGSALPTSVTETYASRGSGVLFHHAGHTRASNKLYLHTAWKAAYAGPVTVAASYNGVSKKATDVNAVTGAVAVESLGDATDLQKGIFPGDWIRIYDHAAAGGYYCDCQVQAQPTTATAIACAVDTMTSSYQMVPSKGKCQSKSTATLSVAHLSSARVVGPEIAVAKQYPSAGEETYTVTDDAAGIYAGSLKVTSTNNIGTNNIAALKITGATIQFTDAAYAVLCQASVTHYVSNTVFYISKTSPNTWGTACAASTANKAAVINAANAVSFSDNLDTFNPTKFNGFAAGDRMRVNGITAGNMGGDVTSTVETVDAINTAAPSALTFKVGVAPNGGGMYPMMSPHTTMFGGRLASHPSAMVAKTSLLQASSAAGIDLGGVSSATSQRITQVLQELPNQVLNDGVTAELTAASLELYSVTATFTGRNSGDQHAIKMNVEGCNVDGCQPRYTGINRQVGYLSSATASVVSAAGSNTLHLDFGAGVSKYVTAGDKIRVYSEGSTSNQGDLVTASSISSESRIVVAGLAAATPTTGFGVVALAAPSANTANKWVKSETYETTRGTTEVTECSGRGLCDGESGECECHTGYTGEACHVQTVLV
jgi:hypothetical protein